VAPSEHKEVPEAELVCGEMLQIGRCGIPGAELNPLIPNDATALLGFRHDVIVGGVERSAAISNEFITGRRLSMRHGVSCG
jgi:hypothetical protein